MDAKVALLKKAQSSGQIGTTFPPRSLLAAIMALATSWSAASPFGPILDSDSPKHRAALRRNIAAAVRLASLESQGGWLRSSRTAKRLFEKTRV